MTTALELPEGWDDRAHPINADGEQGRQELARHCAELWLAAVGVYFRDAQAVMRGVKSADLEALDDLTSDRRLLAVLLKPLDACPRRIGDAMIEALDSGRRFNAAAMNRPVVERPEDYRLGAWRERTKRRGRPEALTLG